jgi:hypothetical protein
VNLVKPFLLISVNLSVNITILSDTSFSLPENLVCLSSIITNSLRIALNLSANLIALFGNLKAFLGILPLQSAFLSL